MSDEVTLEITSAGNLVAIAGEIDVHTATELAEALDQVPVGETLRLDMSAVEFVDSSGLRTLIQAHQDRLAAGGALVVVQPSAVVVRLFDVSGVGDYLHVES